jgi:predicted DCC family thiol-disulfide oxidoreductase YuxK
MCTQNDSTEASPDHPSLPVLPTPEDLPAADVVVYDGNCPFCRSQVARLARWDGRKRLAFVSLHDPLVAARFPDLSGDLMQQMHVVTSDGRRYAGARAVRYLTRRLPRLWLLMPLLHIPFSLPVWQWVYRQIARRRYRGSRPEPCQTACSSNLDPSVRLTDSSDRPD